MQMKNILSLPKKLTKKFNSCLDFELSLGTGLVRENNLRMQFNAKSSTLSVTFINKLLDCEMAFQEICPVGFESASRAQLSLYTIH